MRINNIDNKQNRTIIKKNNDVNDNNSSLKILYINTQYSEREQKVGAEFGLGAHAPVEKKRRDERFLFGKRHE